MLVDGDVSGWGCHMRNYSALGARHLHLYINIVRSRDCRLIWLCGVGIRVGGFYSQKNTIVNTILTRNLGSQMV